MKHKWIYLLASILLAGCLDKSPASDGTEPGNFMASDSNWRPMNPNMTYHFIPDSSSPSGWRLDSSPSNGLRTVHDTTALTDAGEADSQAEGEPRKLMLVIPFPLGSKTLSDSQYLELFRWWKQTLDEEDRMDVAELRRPVYILGYADSTASRAGGAQLARARAEAVLEALDPFVPGEEMDARLASYGGVDPALTGRGRVEVYVEAK